MVKSFIYMRDFMQNVDSFGRLCSIFARETVLQKVSQKNYILWSFSY